jgi:hypothetical protein
VLYTGNLFQKVSREAVKPDGIFTPEDRVGFFLDTLAFGKAGLMKTSLTLSLAEGFRRERNCEDYVLLILL